MNSGGGNNDTAGTTTSTGYTATLTGGGTSPSATVTIPASGNALVILTGRVTASQNTTAFMGYAVSGATTVAASDTRALIREGGGSSSTGYVQASATYRVTGLTAGSNVFTLQYRTSSGTGAFANRNIVVIPLP